MHILRNWWERFHNDNSSRYNLWVACCFCFGIAAYFSLPFEPALSWVVVLSLVVLGCLIFVRRWPVLWCIILLCAGFGWVQIAAYQAKAPTVHWRHHHVAVEGKILTQDILPNAQRLTLQVMHIDGLGKDSVPERIRMRINGTHDYHKGDILQMQATLMPPALPFIPSGYAFSRQAWFQKVGAVGYGTATPKVVRSQTRPSLSNTRLRILRRMREVLPKEQAGVAIPLVVGEQGTVLPKTYRIYKAAGIAHVLSVSGLHLSLIGGFVFMLTRFLLTLIPWLALRLPVKKISALVALCAVFGYLLLSGMAVPAQRAFLMLLVVFLAVLLDRQALSMRTACWACFLILCIAPQSLVSAGFQMSFAAVFVLIAVYERLQNPIARFMPNGPAWLRWLTLLFIGFFISNIAAGAATGLVALYHFHQLAVYSILGNFLTSCLFGFVIMPLLFFAVILMPLHADTYLLLLAGKALGWVNSLAEWVAQLPSALWRIPQLPTLSLVCFLVGILWSCLWRSRERYLGVLLILLGFVPCLSYQAPDILVSQGGQLFSFRDDADVWHFSSATKEKATRRAWLESLGKDPDKAVDASVAQGTHTIQGKRVAFDPVQCHGEDLAFLLREQACDAKQVIGRRALWEKGTHAVWLNDQSIHITTAKDGLFQRYWSGY